MSIRTCEDCGICYANLYDLNQWLCYDCHEQQGGFTTPMTLESEVI